MECTLATLVACFSWSGFFVDVGAQISDRGDQFIFRETETTEIRADGLTESIIFDASRTVDYKRNPYGRFALGYELRLTPSTTLSLHAQHVSSMDTARDRGVNSLMLNVRWHPFGAR